MNNVKAMSEPVFVDDFGFTTILWPFILQCVTNCELEETFWRFSENNHLFWFFGQ